MFVLRAAVAISVACLYFASASWVGAIDTTGKFSGKYLCSPSKITGFRYDRVVREWVPSNFRASNEDNFVLTASYLLERESYNLQISEFGNSEIKTCFAGVIFDDGQIYCRVDFDQINFNLVTMRYLKSYLSGYLKGDQEDDNTPYVEMGTCTALP